MASLIDQDAHLWNLQILHTLFWEEDINSILQIPVGPEGSSDVLVWHYNRSGFYSVKSAYYVARHMKKTHRQTHFAGSSAHFHLRNWDFIWKSKITNKIKIFSWRLLRNALPTTQNLLRRKILPEYVCPVSLSEIEPIHHIFYACHYA